jgi:periplasmic copper chaperone A
MNANALHSMLRGIIAACALAAACAVAAGDPIPGNVMLKTAWLRPAAAGMAEAQAYVDIISESDLVLVGASTPFAKKVELVEVTTKDGQPESKVVASMPVPAGKTTRLAYRGSHLRLVEITKDLGNGTPVPITLAFKSAEGKDVTATISAVVRGVLLPQQMPAVAPKAAAMPDAPPDVPK